MNRGSTTGPETLEIEALEDIQDFDQHRATGGRWWKARHAQPAVLAQHWRTPAWLVITEVRKGDQTTSSLDLFHDRSGDPAIAKFRRTVGRQQAQRLPEIGLHQALT